MHVYIDRALRRDALGELDEGGRGVGEDGLASVRV